MGGEGFFEDFEADVLGGLQDVFACDRGEDVRREGGCLEYSAGDGEKCGGGALGDIAGVVYEDGLGGPLFGGVEAGEDVRQEVEGFDVAPFPSQVGVGRDGDAGGLCGGVVVKLADGEEEPGLHGGVGQVVSGARAACDVEVYASVGDSGGGEGRSDA